MAHISTSFASLRLLSCDVTKHFKFERNPRFINALEIMEMIACSAIGTMKYLIALLPRASVDSTRRDQSTQPPLSPSLPFPTSLYFPFAL